MSDTERVRAWRQRLNWLRVFRSAEDSRIGQGVKGNNVLRERCSQKNAWDSVAEHEAGMRVMTAFFGLCAPYTLTSHVSVFSHYFKRFDRFAKLATSS
jgi:hypothetical protein